MSYWLPWAEKRPLKRNYTNRRRSRTDGIILHVAAGESASLFGWFSNSAARASSHLYVRRDGTVEQYVDLDLISWASQKGDARCISVETQGMGEGEWTGAQVKSLVRILQETSKHYGYPLQTMTSSKRHEKGVGWHRLGVPLNTSQKIRGISQTGGELWSGSPGKICPGPDRIKQIPGIVAQARGNSTTPRPEETLKALADEAGATLIEKDEIDMKMIGIYWKNQAGKTVYALVHPVSGFYAAHSGVSGGYNNALATALETGSWVEVSEAHARVFEQACAQVRGEKQ